MYPCRGGCPHPPAVGRHPPVGTILAAARPYRGGASGRPRPTGGGNLRGGRPGCAAPTGGTKRQDNRDRSPHPVQCAHWTTFPQGKAILHRERWLVKARRTEGTAPAEIFTNPGPSGPGRNRTQALLILRAGNEAPTKQEGVPRNGVRGKATMGTKCPSEPSPAAFWLLCRRGQSNPLSADSGIPPAKIYGPLITLGLQNHFHSRQPR